jgi:hypothetical protein
MRNNEDRFGVENKSQGSEAVENLLTQTKSEGGDTGFSFIVPTEFVNLPSKGKFYPVGHPLKNQETIEIKQMTAKEEDILTSKSLLKKGVALDKLISNLIVDKAISSEMLTSEDRNAIIVAARIGAYGPEYLTTVTCPSCTEKIKYKFNLLETIEKIDEEVEEKTQNLEIADDGTFLIELPSTKWKVRCRVLNGADEKTLLRLSEIKKKSGNDSLLLEQLKLTIVSIQGVSDKDTIQKAIEVLPAKDAKYLRTTYQETVPSVDLTQHFSCTNCDYAADMEVPLSADFFWFK